MLKKQTPQEIYKKMLNCPICGSGKTYFRSEYNNMFCEKCGHTFKRPDPPKA